MTATLVYDGDCAFCTSSVRWVTRLGLNVDEVVPWQFSDLAALGLTQQQCEDKMQLVLPARTWAGHAAAGQLLLRSRWYWKPLGLLLLTPPFSWVARAVYRWVADNRDKMPGGTAACALPQDQRPATRPPQRRSAG
ncbi:MAG TPA: DCC1-like thiol-disulfide oxidoreductase family protein [Mycobacteriales bacterium]|nr:DCC1-like thiol-disulfide oxidoreductase family protein [Mycobacteriales bacterium]